MKHLSISSINNTLTKLQSIPRTSWSSERVKFISTIVTPVTVIIILILIITLHCKCWQYENGCVPKYARPQPPTSSSDINLAAILTLVHGQPHQVTTQVIQEILRSCDVDPAKFECYKSCKSNHQSTKV